MAIAPLSKPIANYIRQFGLTAICRRDGRLGVTRDLSGADRAWWLPADQAGAVLKLARQVGGDIEGAARKAGIVLADHATVLARAGAAIAKIGARLDQAQRTGVLHAFNGEYRRRRLAAFEKGKGFISYREARSRLQRVLAGIAATGTAPEALIAHVFEDRLPDAQ
jgi:hypothetical protein